MDATNLHSRRRSDGAADADDLRVLIVALDAVVPANVPGGQVLVIAPALNSRLRHWLSDDDAARRRAEERLAGLIVRLERRGVHAEGRVVDADPLLAIADALVTFPADRIVIAVGPKYAARPAGELVARARELFALPTSLIPARLARAA
jgi:hypothetical protein